MSVTYADIHHYEGTNPNVVDDDGDPLFGWYFQIRNSTIAFTELIGPYGSHVECETAALSEWEGLAIN